MSIVLAADVLEQVVRHAQSHAPKESCGLIAGRAVGERLIPIRNLLDSTTAFEMEPAELIRSLRQLRESGDQLLAIYHSHPSGPAHPSAEDVRRAYYPEAAHIIVSLETPETPVVRAFRIIDGTAVEIELRAIV